MGKARSLIEMKKFCADNLPLYMIPDRFSSHDVLPKTSTDKINYQALKELAQLGFLVCRCSVGRLLNQDRAIV